MLALVLALALAQVPPPLAKRPPALSLLPGGAGQSYLVPNPCEAVQGIVNGYVGPNGFCAQSLPDAGFNAPAGMTQVDGGALVTFSPGATVPAQVTQRTCNNGPNCAGATFQRFDGGTGAHLVGSTIPGPTADFSCAFAARRRGASTAQYIYIKNPVQYYYSSASATVTTIVYGPDAGPYSVSTGSGTDTVGALLEFGFSYHYVADGSSTLATYYGGAAGASSSSVGGPLQVMIGAANISGYADTAGLVDGDIAFVACSEANWTVAQHLAIARATVGSLTGSYGETVTVTAATARSCQADDGSLTQLPPGRGCVTGGAVKVRPQVINLQKQSETFNSWTLGHANLSDGGVIANPVVTANGCQYPAPDGTMTADLVCFPDVTDLGATPTGYSTVEEAATVTAAAYNTSFWIRAADATDGGRAWWGDDWGVGSQFADAGATWERQNRTTTFTGTSSSPQIGPKPAAGFEQPAAHPAVCVCLWGAQQALGFTASDYCGPTLATAVTCNAETVAMSNPLAGVNPRDFCVEGRVHAGRILSGDIVNIGPAGANNVYLGHGFFGIFDATNTQRYVAITGTSAGLYRGCAVNGTPSVTRDGVLVSGAPQGAGSGIITTQPSAIYIGGTSTGGSTSAEGGISDFAITNLTMPIPAFLSFLPPGDPQLALGAECSGAQLTASDGMGGTVPVTFTRASPAWCFPSDGGQVWLDAGQPSTTARGLDLRLAATDGGIQTANEVALAPTPATLSNAGGCVSATACFTGTPTASMVHAIGGMSGAMPAYLWTATQARAYDSTTAAAVLTITSAANRCVNLRGWWSTGLGKFAVEADGVGGTQTNFDGTMVSTPFGIGSYSDGAGVIDGTVRNLRFSNSTVSTDGGCQ